MSRLPGWLLVTVVWAAIYLPALGLFEIKGEEGRRILPAITMLDTGNYIVPKVGGMSYFSKPPLVNWLIAATFKLFGVRNEWTARLPSALCVLAVALAFVTVARASLNAHGSTIAALIWLTNLGILEKGRLIEIEALYVSLCALAIIFWLSLWTQNRSPWLTWTVPWIFLGLGWLAKGPTLLVFFYAVVFAVLWQERRGQREALQIYADTSSAVDRQWKALLHPAHFLGVLLMLAIFAAWAVPFYEMTAREQPIDKWSGQFIGRMRGDFFRPHVWITTLPRTLIYFLPWLLFLPLLRLNKFCDERQRALVRALLWGTAVPFLAIDFIPGAAARYSLPVIAPCCWLMAMSFAEDAFAIPAWFRQRFTIRDSRVTNLWSRIGIPLVAVAAAAGLIGYPLAATLVYKHRPKIKNIAEAVNALVPANEVLYAVDPRYQPFFFYAHSPVKYVLRLVELPKDTRYFVTRAEMEPEVTGSAQWLPHRAHEILRRTDYRKQTIVVFRVDSF
ncbi:MAG TPA: glycosyltransferase family 39 protein [Chthoniobacterales bacterium]|jgi:4-amino-4-deoxy-L-arabinose transferase-like glycosyltransferase